MSAKRITMRKIRDVLRLRFAAGLSIRQIKASTKVSVGAIQKLLAKAEEEGLSWPLPPELDDESRPGLPVLPWRRYAGLYPLSGTGLAHPAPGAQGQGRHQTAALGGVHPAVPEPLLQLLPVLRALRTVEGPAEALHAPDPQGR